MLFKDSKQGIHEQMCSLEESLWLLSGKQNGTDPWGSGAISMSCDGGPDQGGMVQPGKGVD